MRAAAGGSAGELFTMGFQHHLIAALAAAALSLVCAVSPALAQKRVALVVGNDSYPHLGNERQLNNAVSDARAMRTTLQGLGFDVLYGENLDRRTFVDRLFDLAARLNKDDTAFFFFAGHGVSFSGANYLLPSDVPAPRATGRAEEGRLAEQAVAETTVIERITSSGARVAILVLDACRDNPLQGADKRSLGATRGLAQSHPARGVFSIYSAGFGQAALDRLGPDDRNPNSVFTRVFIEKMKTPGLDLKALATQTRSDVVEMTQKIGHDQFPAYYDQVIGADVYLAGAPAAPRTPPPPAVVAAAGPSTPVVATPPLPPPPVTVLPAPPPSLPPVAALPPPRSDGSDIVREFYAALGRGDGRSASLLIIPEKRASGPFSAEEMTRFYGALAEPLRLINVAALGDNKFQATYTFRSRSKTCDGAAIVTVVNRGGQALIERVQALKGC
jgi:hypothetical protein